jgi:hypothetical protein
LTILPDQGVAEPGIPFPDDIKSMKGMWSKEVKIEIQSSHQIHFHN